MKKYSLTSTAFSGEVLFEFYDNELLTKFDTSNAQLSQQQQKWILKEMPRELSEIKRVLGNSNTATLTDLSVEITFDIFWDRYDEKVRSSKKRSERKWNRMSQSERNKAYWYIQKYLNNLQQGTSKKYAETYLNDELWNN